MLLQKFLETRFDSGFLSRAAEFDFVSTFRAVLRAYVKRKLIHLTLEGRDVLFELCISVCRTEVVLALFLGVRLAGGGCGASSRGSLVALAPLPAIEEARDGRMVEAAIELLLEGWGVADRTDAVLASARKKVPNVFVCCEDIRNAWRDSCA